MFMNLKEILEKSRMKNEYNDLVSVDNGVKNQVVWRDRKEYASCWIL